MEKRYLLSLTAAAALGYGLGEADLLEAQAMSINHCQRSEITLSPAAAGTWENYLGNQLCPQIDSDFELAPGTCTVALIKQRAQGGVGVHWTDGDGDGDNEWVLGAQNCADGQFVAD